MFLHGVMLNIFHNGSVVIVHFVNYFLFYFFHIDFNIINKKIIDKYF